MDVSTVHNQDGRCLGASLVKSYSGCFSPVRVSGQMGSRKDWKLVLVRYIWPLFPSPASKDLMGGGAHTVVTRKSRRTCFYLLVSLPVLDTHHVLGNGLDCRQSCIPGIWSYSSSTFFRPIHCWLIGLCFFRAGHNWTPHVESVPWFPSVQNHLRKCHHFWLHSPVGDRHASLWFQSRCCKWSKGYMHQ